MSRDNGGNFLLGAIFGAIAGAVAGILLAPKSGEETRRALGEKAKEYGEKGRDLAEKGGKIAKEKIHEVAETIADKTKK